MNPLNMQNTSEQCISTGLSKVWERLQECYGSAEALERALLDSLEHFPRISNKDPHLLRDLGDLLLEINSATFEMKSRPLKLLTTILTSKTLLHRFQGSTQRQIFYCYLGEMLFRATRCLTSGMGLQMLRSHRSWLWDGLLLATSVLVGLTNLGMQMFLRPTSWATELLRPMPKWHPGKGKLWLQRSSHY